MKLLHHAKLLLSLVALTLTSCGGSATVTQTRPADEVGQPEPAWPTELLAGTDSERVVVPTDGAPAKGAEAPLVTIVEFSDFQCPFCSRANPTLDRLLQNYPGDVRIVFRHNPLAFHKQAVPAAVVSLEAQTQRGDEGFWKAHDMLFDNQAKLGSLEETAGLIESIRRELNIQPTPDEGVDELLGRIENDMEIAARVGARGTPIFFINGRELSGAQPYAKFEAIVDEEIQLAKVALGRGAQREQLYALVMEAAEKAPETQVAPEPQAQPTPAVAAGPLPGRPDPKATYYVPVGNAPVLGQDDALVTIVTFSDFECPFCARVQPTLERIREHYDNDVRIVFKNNPLAFHQKAKPLAMIALEAQRQGNDAAFWKVHDKFFASQAELSEEFAEAVFKELNLKKPKPSTVARFRKRYEARIEEEQAEARRLGAMGTPAFFINGRFLSGAQPYDTFAALIDEEKAEAEKLVSDGVPRKKLYAKVIEDGIKEVEKPQAVAQAEERYEVPVPNDAPSKGPKNAPVTVQIFSDFQCPFCSRVVPTIRALEREYRGKLRFVWYHYPLPFHQQAPLAHEASVEAFKQKGSRGFWRFHDLFFENQRELAADQLVGYAKKEGLNAKKFTAALENRTHQDRVKADVKRVEDAGMRIGTPTFLINGTKLSGAQPIELFREHIDTELEKLKK